MWTPQCVPRAIALPTVLVTPTQRAPLETGRNKFVNMSPSVLNTFRVDERRGLNRSLLLTDGEKAVTVKPETFPNFCRQDIGKSGPYIMSSPKHVSRHSTPDHFFWRPIASSAFLPLADVDKKTTFQAIANFLRKREL